MVDRSAGSSNPLATVPAPAAPAGTGAAPAAQGVAPADASAVIVQATLLDLKVHQVEAQRSTLAQLDADLSQALARYAAAPSAPLREHVQQLMQQAQQLRQDLMAHGVNLPPLDLPGLPPSAVPASPSTPLPAPGSAPAGAVPTAPAFDAARAVLVATAPGATPDGAPASGLPRSVLASAVPSMVAEPAGNRRATPSRVAAESPSTPVPVHAQHPWPQAHARLADLPPTRPSPSPPTGAAPQPVPQAAAAPSPLPSTLPDRSAFSELERQRTVSASRGSLDEASTRQARRAGHQPEHQAPARDDHLLTAGEWADLAHRWQCCQLALQAWTQQPGHATEAAVRQAFDGLDQFGRWMAARGKSVPPAPADLVDPFATSRP